MYKKLFRFAGILSVTTFLQTLALGSSGYASMLTRFRPLARSVHQVSKFGPGFKHQRFMHSGISRMYYSTKVPGHDDFQTKNNELVQPEKFQFDKPLSPDLSSLKTDSEATDQQIAFSMSRKEFDQILAQNIQRELTKFHEELKNDGDWDLDYARQKVVEELVSQGFSQEDAEARFKEMDAAIDRERRLLKFPYLAGAFIPAAGIPATWALVYHAPFYDWVSTKWPWLVETSWDWSEPLVQTLLTTETGGALMLGSMAALGYRSYMRFINKRLTSKFAKNGNISMKTAKKFIKVDK